MSTPPNFVDFDLTTFLPYLLNRAAETSSLEFQRYYRDTYAMLRTEWRVLFHLWQYGDMTAKDICSRASLHKTKVSRAVVALERKRFVVRTKMPHDRRNELLTLTTKGRAASVDLTQAAARFDAALTSDFSSTERAVLRKCLQKLSGI
jgi:DNA-binding MarR family transcriptional regulator